MLASLLRKISFMTFGVAGVILGFAFGLSLATVAWLVLASLVVFCGLLAFQFMTMRRSNRHESAPALTAPQVLRAWWLEARVALHVFCWLQPFRASAHPDWLPQKHADANTRGVVLVHGFLCNRALWFRWFPVLRGSEVPFVAVNLEPIFTSIDDYAPIIDDAITRMHEATGLPPLVVCHSMGGLAVRAWLRRTGGSERIHAAVTIGSPHGGTKVCDLIPPLETVKNAEQMRYESVWLRDLNAQESVRLHSRFVCFYSDCDNIVFPSSTARLDGADNRLVTGIPHLAMAMEPAIIDQVLGFLKAPA